MPLFLLPLLAVQDTMPGCKLDFSLKGEAGPVPTWFAEVERQTQDWFRRHPREWKRLPYSDYQVGVQFEHGWPQPSDVGNAQFRRGTFLTVTVRGDAAGIESRTEARSYAWGEGGWIERIGKMAHLVPLERGVTSYIETSLQRFCKDRKTKSSAGG